MSKEGKDKNSKKGASKTPSTNDVFGKDTSIHSGKPILIPTNIESRVITIPTIVDSKDIVITPVVEETNTDAPPAIEEILEKTAEKEPEEVPHQHPVDIRVLGHKGRY